MTRICFVRHGETDWNVEMRLQGQTDRPLNPVGAEQARGLGLFFRGAAIDALYSSDLLRARQTAQPISNALGLPIINSVGLRERHFGRCEGLTIEEIREMYPDDALAIKSRDPDYAAPGGGESRRQHQMRVEGFVMQLAGLHPLQSIVVVTHGGVLDVLYRRVKGLSLEAPRDYPLPNAGINWLSIEGDRWVIESWGNTACQG